MPVDRVSFVLLSSRISGLNQKSGTNPMGSYPLTLDIQVSRKRQAAVIVSFEA